MYVALEAVQNAMKGSSAGRATQSEIKVPPRKGGKYSIRFFNHWRILRIFRKLRGITDQLS
jgi:hypothetical protein